MFSITYTFKKTTKKANKTKPQHDDKKKQQAPELKNVKKTGEPQLAQRPPKKQTALNDHHSRKDDGTIKETKTLVSYADVAKKPCAPPSSSSKLPPTPKQFYTIKYLPSALLELPEIRSKFVNYKSHPKQYAVPSSKSLPPAPTKVYPAIPYITQMIYQEEDPQRYYILHNVNMAQMTKHQQPGQGLPPSKFSRRSSNIDRLIKEIIALRTKGPMLPLGSKILPGYLHQCFVPFGNHYEDFSEVVKGKYRPCIILLVKENHCVVLSLQDNRETEKFENQEEYMVKLTNEHMERTEADSLLRKEGHNTHAVNLYTVHNDHVCLEYRYGRVKDDVLKQLQDKLIKYINDKCG